jgi:hypothetical protein
MPLAFTKDPARVSFEKKPSERVKRTVVLSELVHISPLAV